MLHRKQHRVVEVGIFAVFAAPFVHLAGGFSKAQVERLVLVLIFCLHCQSVTKGNVIKSCRLVVGILGELHLVDYILTLFIRFFAPLFGKTVVTFGAAVAALCAVQSLNSLTACTVGFQFGFNSLFYHYLQRITHFLRDIFCPVNILKETVGNVFLIFCLRFLFFGYLRLFICFFLFKHRPIGKYQQSSNENKQRGDDAYNLAAVIFFCGNYCIVALLEVFVAECHAVGGGADFFFFGTPCLVMF